MGLLRKLVSTATKTAIAAVETGTQRQATSTSSELSLSEKKAYVLKVNMQISSNFTQLGIQPPLTIFKRGSNGEGICETYWESEDALFTVFENHLTAHRAATADEKRAILVRVIADEHRGRTQFSCQIVPGEPTRVIELFLNYNEMIDVHYVKLRAQQQNAQEHAAVNTDLQNAMNYNNANLMAVQQHMLHTQQHFGIAPTHYENGVPHYNNPYPSLRF